MRIFLIKPLIDLMKIEYKKISTYNINQTKFYVVNDYFNLANCTELKVAIAK